MDLQSFKERCVFRSAQTAHGRQIASIEPLNRGTERIARTFADRRSELGNAPQFR